MASFTPAIIIGGGIGAYTQDPLDHPISAAIGAGIGGYAASAINYHSYIKPVASVSSSKIKVPEQSSHMYGESIKKRLAGMDAKMNGYAEGLNSDRVDIRENTKRAVNKYVEGLETISKNVNTVMSHQFGLTALNSETLGSPAGRDALRNFVNAHSTNSTALKMLYSTMDFDTSITVADLKVSANLQKSNAFKISSTTNAVDAEKMIREYLINQLGHGGELAKTADLKAKVISEALSGFDYSVGENGLNVTANGKTDIIPLTGYDNNGVRYTKVGGVRQGVTAFNPFAGQILGKNDVQAGTALAKLLGRTGAIDHNDALKQYDSELKLAFYDFKEGNPARVLSAAASSIRSDSEYMSAEAHGETSTVGKRERLSTHVAPYKVSEKGRLVPVSHIATNKNKTPEIRELTRILTRDSGRNILGGVGVNSLGSFNATGENQFFAGFLPTMERGADTVLDRGYASNGADPELARLLGVSPDELVSNRKYAGLSNAVVANRLDVDDDLSRLASNIFGTHVSLDDGAGIFRIGSASKFEVVQNVTLDIGSSGDGKFMLSGDLHRINEVLEGGAAREEALKYFEGRTLRGGTSIGFDGLGAPVKLGKEYSTGQIVDAFMDNGKLRISVKANYVPDEWMKIFSSATKSGLTSISDTEFETLTGIENMRRQGLLSVDPSGMGVTLSSGEEMTYEDIHKHINQKLNDNEENMFQKYKMDADIISRSSDTGTDLIAAARSNNLSVLDKFSKRFAESTKVSGTIGTAVGALSSTDQATRVASAKFLLAISDNKANSDMYLTGIHEASLNGDAMSVLELHGQQANMAAGLLSTDKNVREQALSDVYGTYLRSDDSGVVKTTATIDLGSSLRGVGNQGRISWNEQLNLKANGWTAEDMKAIGANNADALYELSMVEARTKQGVDYTAQKLKYKDKIANVFEKSAGGRIQMFEEMGMKPNADGFIHYNLHTNIGGMRSIGIPLRDTNLSGLLDIDGRQLVKQIDSSRQSLILADLNLANLAETQRGSDAYKEALRVFKESADSYNRSVNRMFSGENNLMKNSMRLTSDRSVIHNFRSGDGEFGEHISRLVSKNKAMIPAIGFSEEGFAHFAKRVELGSYELKPVNGSRTLFQVTVPTKDEIMFNGQKRTLVSSEDYKALITREPSMGSLSTYAADVYIDKSIIGGVNQVYIPKINVNGIRSLSAMYQFADFDSDTGRITSLHGLTKSSRKRILEVQNAMLETAYNIANLQTAMGSKTQENELVTVAKFAKPIDYEQYLAAGAQKGKFRKMLAPFATDIATNMNASLEKHLNSLNLSEGDFIKRSMTGRSVIHNLVENLLKTQHQKTDPAAMAAMTDMESMLHAHEDLLKDGDKSAYKTKATSIFDKILGAGVEKNGNSASKAAYNAAVNDITEGSSRYAAQIDLEGWEQKHGRFSAGSSADKLDNYIKAVSAKGMLPHEISESLESNIEVFSKNARGYFEYAKNLVSSNKRVLGAAGLSLAVTAAFIGSEPPDLSKETLPSSNKNGILQPIPTEKGYVTKGRDYRSPKSYNVHASNAQGDPRQKARELFQDKSRSNVIIKDKRDR